MNDKQLSKVKKCFELAKSGNVNEAANALAMAQKLMKKYGMSDEDIKFMEMGETTSKSIIQKKPTAQVVILLRSIARAFSVDVLHTTDRMNNCHPQYLGRKDQAMMAAYAFDVIYRQMNIARSNYLKVALVGLRRSIKTSRADAYCHAWALAAVQNLHTSTQSEEEKQKIEAYRDHNNPELKDQDPVKTRIRQGCKDDYIMGHEDGSGVSIATPVSGTETVKLGCFA